MKDPELRCTENLCPECGEVFASYVPGCRSDQEIRRYICLDCQGWKPELEPESWTEEDFIHYDARMNKWTFTKREE